jgi:4-hydroxybenzoate polyprenyltransferase
MRVFINFLKLIRLPNLIIIGLTQYAIRFGIIAPFLDQASLGLFLSEKLFACLVLATILIAAAGYIINDYFDVKLDYLNKPKQMVIGKSISRRQAIFLHTSVNIIGMALATYVAFSIHHPMLILFQLVSSGLLWFYSVSFKKQVLIGNIIIAILTALVPFTAGYYEVAVMLDEVKEVGSLASESLTANSLGSLLFSIQYLLYWIVGYSVFAFLLTLIREVIKDCEDIEGDKAFNCKTLPIVLGIKKAKNVAIYVSLLLLGMIFLLQLMQYLSKDWISLTYFLVFISAPLVWVILRTRKAQSKKHFFIISQSIKVIMLFGILYTGVIYFF